MPIINLLILALIFSTAYAQPFVFKLYHCETTSLIQIEGNSLLVENLMFETVDLDTVISPKDLADLNTHFTLLFKQEGNKVWLNNCVDDGTNLKFWLTQNEIAKKVFVGNYFDKRLSSIVIILNKYLSEIDSVFIMTIPYGSTNKKKIKRLIRDQKRCKESPEDYKNRMLHQWCEPERQDE